MSEDTSDKSQATPCPSCGATFEGRDCACGWRRSWSDPKKKKPTPEEVAETRTQRDESLARVRARARETAAVAISEAMQRWLKEPRPDSETLVDEALQTLRGLMLAEGVPIEPKDRIAAASRVLEWVRGNQDFAQELERIQGTPEAALEWCERMAAGLREKIAAKALPGGAEGKKGR